MLVYLCTLWYVISQYKTISSITYVIQVKEGRHKRITHFWFHVYEVQKQAKLSNVFLRLHILSVKSFKENKSDYHKIQMFISWEMGVKYDDRRSCIVLLGCSNILFLRLIGTYVNVDFYFFHQLYKHFYTHSLACMLIFKIKKNIKK